MKSKAACLSALFLLSCSSVGAAGPIVDAAERAEALQAEGKTVEALEALNEAVDELWTEGDLAFRKVVLVESAGALGTFEERSGSSYQPDDKLRVYVEPVGFGYGQSGDAASIGFTADLAIENTTGQVLTEVDDLFTISAESAPGRREFGMTLAFGVPYLRPGDYLARFTVRDQNSEKTGTFDVAFTVAAPGTDDAEPGEGPAAPAASSGAGATGGGSTGGAAGGSAAGAAGSDTNNSGTNAGTGAKGTGTSTSGTGSSGGASATTGSSTGGSAADGGTTGGSTTGGGSATGGTATGGSTTGGSANGNGSGTGGSTGGGSAAGAASGSGTTTGGSTSSGSGTAPAGETSTNGSGATSTPQ